MRIAPIVLLASCVYTSQDTDGQWTALTEPCVPLGETRVLLRSPQSVVFSVAGATLLYSEGVDISQRSLVTDEDRVVIRSDHVTLFGSVDNDLVYFESDGDREHPVPIDVVVDHGARSSSRYERISPHPGHIAAGLAFAPHGTYWWTIPPDSQPIEEWRWDPETDAVTPFPTDRRSIVRSDDASLFYFDSLNRPTVRSQTTGELHFVQAAGPVDITPFPLGIDGDELFYVDDDATSAVLVARSFGGDQRVLTRDVSAAGALGGAFIYFVASQTTDLEQIARDGSSARTVFAGGFNSRVFDVTTDACNVYWQHLTMDGAAIYGRSLDVL